MAERKPENPSLPADPVLEVLRGGDPAVVAKKAGMSADDLIQWRDAFLKAQAKRAIQENVIFQKVGRNDPCPCGSGLKYKKCCMHVHETALAGMDPEAVQKRRQHEQEKGRRDKQVKKGYALLTRGDYLGAHKHARGCLERYPEDDRFHDILATAALYLDQFEEAIQVSESRWKAAEREKALFLAHGRHTYDDPSVAPGHAYAPQAWLEKYWVAIKARDYTEAYPKTPDQWILRQVKALQNADDLERFPQRREEGLQVRQEALANVTQALKDIGPEALPYLLPLSIRYSWTGLLLPEILCHWGDDASIRALVDIALFHYPFLSESCLKALEELGDRSLPHIMIAFEQDPKFVPLKTGLISVAGHIATPEAMEWITSLLDHPDAAIVNWAGGILGKAGYVQALAKLEETNRRIGGEPRMQEAIDTLRQLSKQE